MKRKPPINYLITLVITGKVKSADMMRPVLLYFIRNINRLNDFASVSVMSYTTEEERDEDISLSSRPVAASPSSCDFGSQVCQIDHWSNCGNPAVMGFSIHLT